MLTDIPEELKIKILSFLDAVALARCSMTCKLICETIKSSSLLVYTIQLHLNGMEGTGLTAPHADLLEHLLRYRQAWLSLELGKPVTLQLTQLYDDQDHKLVGPTLAYTNREGIVHIISLPTSSKIEKYMSQTFVITFAMDPTQDMIAILCEDETVPSYSDPRIISIHIRTMSTDISHPLAQNSCLMRTIYPRLSQGTNRPKLCSLSIAHNILAFTYFDPVRRWCVMIWDWTTSDLILDSSVALDPLLPPIDASQFGLIDYMYCLIVSPIDSGSIRLYKFIRPSGVTAPAIHLATLHLPPISTGISITGLAIQDGPFMAQTTSHIPLGVKNEDRLYLFTLIYIEGAGGPRSSISINLFVHQRVFMHYIEHYTDTNAGLPLDIPWTEWGPQNTRIICPAYRTTARWRNSCIHGQRVVQFPRITEGDPGAPPSVEVLDFSHAAVLPAQGVLPRPSSLSMNFTGLLSLPSIIRHPYFKDNVETYLPCVSWTRELPKQYDDFLINDDYIIGVQNEFETLILDIFSVGVQLI